MTKAKGKGHARSGGGSKKKTSAKAKPKEKRIKSYPEQFCVEVPKTIDGKVVRDDTGMPVSVKEYGEYTCYHIAHLESWKKHLYDAQQAVIEQLAIVVESASSKNKKKTKTRKKNKRKRDE